MKIRRQKLHPVYGRFITLILLITYLFQPAIVKSQSFFVDGYHGGIWGHFPDDFASYMATELQQHPNWRLNLEIEPVTWDSIKSKDPLGYQYFQRQFMDTSLTARVEYINPAYGQPYMWNISAESIIRQFKYGIQTLKRHFPNISFSTYSSEEPCFTSALPAILKDFGFQYASLKNPNTCWGGYTSSVPSALFQWTAPNGQSIATVPRYRSEALEKGSTWQTTAWHNDPNYYQTALEDGITMPVGMCLQDAGWREGPWIGSQPQRSVQYTTWKYYFSKLLSTAAAKQKIIPSKNDFSQEDIKVSLVWGGQILQRVAKAVRQTENKLVSAETVAAINHLFDLTKPVKDEAKKIELAWKNLLLAQHHDCWIVPYNKRFGKTWQEHVSIWTDTALGIADQMLHQQKNNGSIKPQSKGIKSLRVYNPTGFERTEIVQYFVGETPMQPIAIQASKPQNLIATPYQLNKVDSGYMLYFEAKVPSVGFNTYQLKPVAQALSKTNNIIRRSPNGNYLIETNKYRLVLDPKKGGEIVSLRLKANVAKSKKGLNNSYELEFIAKAADHDKNSIGALKGYFYKEQRFHTSDQSPINIKILNNGPLFASVKISGKIGGHPFIKTLFFSSTDPLIRTSLEIQWQRNLPLGIGAYDQDKTFRNEDPHKAFYNSRYKLLSLFDVDIPNFEIYKDAPFDVIKSRLKNTFYNRWDSIKNDVLLHWVDLYSPDKDYGFTLFTDRTTSYASGEGLPLGLTTQYIGKGLFGADYKVDGPTIINYAFMPHVGNWKSGDVHKANTRFNQPLEITELNGDVNKFPSIGSLLNISANADWEVTAFKEIYRTNDKTLDKNRQFLLRLYNISGDDQPHPLSFTFKPNSLTEVALNGKIKKVYKPSSSHNYYQIQIPVKGFINLILSYPN